MCTYKCVYTYINVCTEKEREGELSDSIDSHDLGILDM